VRKREEVGRYSRNGRKCRRNVDLDLASSDFSIALQAREELAWMPARVCGREVDLWLRSPKLTK